ncbi:MAG: hypothetical protein ACI97B_002940, partial [Verrucomicrobiales bacterium]
RTIRSREPGAPGLPNQQEVTREQGKPYRPAYHQFVHEIGFD